MTLSPRSRLGRAQSLFRQMEAKLERQRPTLRDLADFWSPHATYVDQHDRQDDVSPDILDDSVYFCRVTLASGFFWGMTNPARIWSEWSVGDPSLRDLAGPREFLHELNLRRHIFLHRANFYDTMSWVYDEWPTFGTAVVIIEEDPETVFRYIPWAIGTYSIADGKHGEPSALSRRYPMTCREVVERFATRPDGSIDMGRLSLHMRSLVQGNQLEETVTVCQLICPNDDHQPTSDLPEHYRYASLYWEDNAQDSSNGYGGFLAREGYREWPAMVFRWRRRPGTPFGCDHPGQLSLGTNKSLQAMESDLLLAIEKQGKPPLSVPEDKVVSLLPGARNVFSANARVAPGPLHTVEPAAIERIAAAQTERRARMESIWYTRLMLAFAMDPRVQRPTAREVEEVSQEKYLVLGRVLESAAQQFKVAAEREFAIMNRLHLLPDVPPEMEGVQLDIEFTSMLAVAQKAVGLQSLLEFGSWAANVAAAPMPDSVNVDELINEVGQRSALPPGVVRSAEDLAAIRQARAEAEAEAARAEQAAQEARAVKDLGTTPMDTDSALSRVLGSMENNPLPTGSSPL